MCPHQTPVCSSILPLRATCSTNFYLLDLIARTIFSVRYIFRNNILMKVKLFYPCANLCPRSECRTQRKTRDCCCTRQHGDNVSSRTANVKLSLCATLESHWVFSSNVLGVKSTNRRLRLAGRGLLSHPNSLWSFYFYNNQHVHNKYHNSLLCNLHCYMIRHFYVIIKELQPIPC